MMNWFCFLVLVLSPVLASLVGAQGVGTGDYNGLAFVNDRFPVVGDAPRNFFNYPQLLVGRIL